MGMSLVPILASKEENEIYVTSRKERHSDYKNVHWLTGNAHDDIFLNHILKTTYDVIIDFMVYQLEEFKDRAGRFLASARQYIFLSSSRVYADSPVPITEDMPRLLDTCVDREYLSTDEYALDKARQEDALRSLGKKNWTIVRPYITYNSNRFQLGTLEKENWLYRALHGRTVVFTKDIAEHVTTLTYGHDVAERIAVLAGNEKAFGETFHITGKSTMKWGEVLNLYLDVLENVTGRRPKVCLMENSNVFQKVLNGYQIKYDRLYDRRFDNSKIESICGNGKEYMQMREGLEMCLKTFLKDGGRFLPLYWKNEAIMDRITHERTKLKEFDSLGFKLKYLVGRYTPYLYGKIRKH